MLALRGNRLHPAAGSALLAGADRTGRRRGPGRGLLLDRLWSLGARVGSEELMPPAAAGAGKQSSPGPSPPLRSHPGRAPRCARPRPAGDFGGARAPVPALPPASRALPGPAARAGSALSPPLPASPRPPPPRPELGTVAGPEREHGRHLSCCHCLQRSASSADRRALAARARGPASRRRLLRGPRCSPRCEAAGSGPLEPRSAPRAPPCRSRLGPAAVPGAREMLRRPALAVAPAAWLLLAGLLRGNEVGASRGECRGRVPEAGSGRRGRGQASRAGSGHRRPGARTAGAPGSRTLSRAGHLGSGRPHRSPGWWRRGFVGGAEEAKGRSIFLGRSRRLGPHPQGRCCVRVYVLRMCIGRGVHAQFLVCACLHKSPLLRIPFRDPESATRTPHLCRFPPPPRVLSANKQKLELLAPLPPFHPKVRL